jgi:DNA polymerase eta
MGQCRVIVHVDLDSFYSVWPTSLRRYVSVLLANLQMIVLIMRASSFQQVEELRLGLKDHQQPLAVLQWDALIAVNYPARSRGIKRYVHVFACARRCDGEC